MIAEWIDIDREHCAVCISSYYANRNEAIFVSNKTVLKLRTARKAHISDSSLCRIRDYYKFTALMSHQTHSLSISTTTSSSSNEVSK